MSAPSCKYDYPGYRTTRVSTRPLRCGQRSRTGQQTTTGTREGEGGNDKRVDRCRALEMRETQAIATRRQRMHEDDAINAYRLGTGQKQAVRTSPFDRDPNATGSTGAKRGKPQLVCADPANAGGRKEPEELRLRSARAVRVANGTAAESARQDPMDTRPSSAWPPR